MESTSRSARSQERFFYGTIYIAYEWLILAFAGVGLLVTIRRRSIVGMWFAAMAIVQFAVYSWAGEKFAWLALHPLVPMVLLAGLGGQAAWDRLRRPRAGQSRRPDLVTAVVVAGAGLAAIGTLVIESGPPSRMEPMRANSS